jgi:hypothetical protein
MNRRYLAEICTVFALGLSLILEVLLNGMKPWVTPDTASYLARYSWPDCLGQPRIPLYGWFVDAITLNSGHDGLIPWVQFLLFSICCLFFVKALATLNLDQTARAAAGISLGLSNVILIWCRALMPTVPAVSFLLVAMSGVIWMTAQKPRNDWGICLLIGLATALAWLLDPGLLLFILVLPLMFWPLSAVQNGRQRVKKSGMIFVACLAPFLAMSSLRAAEVGDFNIVSFGGFQMSGMASLILSPATIDRIAPPFRPLAAAILAGRTKQELNGTTIATPANSVGQRSFPSEAIGYFDILARTHDSVVYGAVAAQRGQGESWVAFNKRLEFFSIAAIRANPVNYIAWVIGGLSRLVGHALVLNPIFIVPAALSLLLFLGFPSSFESSGGAAGIAPLRLIIFFYTVGATLLTVLITFPAQRYIDVGGAMLAALPIYTLMRQVRTITGRA